MTEGSHAMYEAFRALGISSEEIEAAQRSGTLLALAAERVLLPGEREFDPEDVASACGVETQALTRLWRAMGLPQSAGSKPFTQQDIDLTRTFLGERSALDDYWLQEIRVISASLARVAEVFVDEIWDHHFSAGQSEGEALLEMAPTVDLDRMDRILLYLLRRHLVAGIYRRLALHDQATRYGAPSMAVGIADLVGYSVLTQDMSDSELTGLVVNFDTAAYDLVAELNGRVVKTLGDGVIFTSDDAGSAAEIAVRLTAVGLPDLPPVHVGLAWGPVLIRQGDCFGPTVNLVSRLVGCAAAGQGG